MKTIQITFDCQNNEDLSLSFETANSGSVSITAYSSTMDFHQFCELCDSLQELRMKWASLQNNNSNTPEAV